MVTAAVTRAVTIASGAIPRHVKRSWRTRAVGEWRVGRVRVLSASVESELMAGGSWQRQYGGGGGKFSPLQPRAPRPFAPPPRGVETATSCCRVDAAKQQTCRAVHVVPFSCLLWGMIFDGVFGDGMFFGFGWELYVFG